MSTPSSNPVIVVGSGLAGLCASYEALKAGRPVHMLERAAKPGGNSIKASSGINGARTQYQKAAGIENDDSFYDDSIRSAGGRFRDWKSQPKNSGIRRDYLVHMLVNQSAAAVAWMADEIGVDLSVVVALGGHTLPRTHRGSGKMPPGAAMVTTLLKKLQADPGFTLTTSVTVTDLCKEDGVVTGVLYAEAEGDSQRLEGPVVFASGGFAGDAHGLLAKYRPDLASIPSTNEAREGSHQILSAVGAELVDMDSVQIHPSGFVDPAAPDSMVKFLAAEMLRGEGGILISSEGKRFVNEMETREHVSKAIMSLPPLDNAKGEIRQWDVTVLLDPGACDAAASHISFYLFKGLMQKKKIKELNAAVIESIDRYAAMVAAGRDDDFDRKNFGRWRLRAGEDNREEEVCIGKVTPVVHFTMGGVAFNEKAQVLRAAGDGVLVPISGLFAAGEITGGIHGDNRLGGSSLLECVVFGRIAGREAAAC